jgi:ABC-type phosphate/phosphonate transport system substrate-binding protein
MLERCACRIAVAAAGIGLCFASFSTRAADPKPMLQIGMIQTLFRGAESGAMMAQSEPFSVMLQAQTGLRGQVRVVPDEAEMARLVGNGQLQLGILHGIEYAWIKKQHPDLHPLVVAFNQSTKLRGYVLVREDSAAQGVADLADKSLAFPARSLNHCYLFLDKSIREAGLSPAGFFAESPTVKNAEAALDAVVDGAAVAAVVDGVALDTYRQRKPGRAKRLRTLKESGYFPTATVIYKPSTCDQTAAKSFRDGMTQAHQKPMGRQFLNLWRLSQFGDVPEEYGQLLADVLKEYPEPLKPAAFFKVQPSIAATPAETSAGRQAPDIGANGK